MWIGDDILGDAVRMHQRSCESYMMITRSDISDACHMHQHSKRLYRSYLEEIHIIASSGTRK